MSQASSIAELTLGDLCGTSDLEWAAIKHILANSGTQEERENWAAKQPPLLASLDPADAEDADDVPVCLPIDNYRQNRPHNVTNGIAEHLKPVI